MKMICKIISRLWQTGLAAGFLLAHDRYLILTHQRIITMSWEKCPATERGSQELSFRTVNR